MSLASLPAVPSFSVTDLLYVTCSSFLEWAKDSSCGLKGSPFQVFSGCVYKLQS